MSKKLKRRPGGPSFGCVLRHTVQKEFINKLKCKTFNREKKQFSRRIWGIKSVFNRDSYIDVLGQGWCDLGNSLFVFRLFLPHFTVFSEWRIKLHFLIFVHIWSLKKKDTIFSFQGKPYLWNCKVIPILFFLFFFILSLELGISPVSW